LFQDRVISIEAYEREVFFSVQAPEFEGRVYLAIAGNPLSPAAGYSYPPVGRTDFSWNIPPDLRGRFGYAQDLVVTFEGADGERASHTTHLQITPGHLDADELRMLLDDLVYLLFLDWKSPTVTDFRAITGVRARTPILTWNLIREHADELLVAMQQIAVHPHQALRQVHYETRFRIGHRLDTNSVRWLAQRGLSPQALAIGGENVLVPHDVLTADILENRFILFVLRRVTRLLETLESAIEGQIREEKRNEALEIARNRARNGRKKVAEIRRGMGELKHFEEERRKLEQHCKMVARHPFFQDINLDETTFVPPADSLVLMQEPLYFQVFDFYNKLQAKAEIEWLSRAEGLTRRLTRAGTDRMSSIYENWAFVRVYHEMRLLGFTPCDGFDLEDMIIGDRLNPRLAWGNARRIEMLRDAGRNGHLRLKLCHEREFWGDRSLPSSKKWAWKPDITIEIWQGKSKRGLVFLDAKYKDFFKRDKYFDGLKHLRKELYESEPGKRDGIDKYLQISGAIASFILHPTTYPDFENYGAQVPRNKRDFDLDDTQPRNHELGYIPFRPASTSAFRKFMGMIFVLKLGFDFYCWNCHSLDVQIGDKSNERYCQDCDTRWWRNHCRCSGHSLIIKGDEVPFQVQVSPGNYLCPSCGRKGDF